MNSRSITSLIIGIALGILGAPILIIFVAAIIYFQYHVPLHELVPGALIILDPILMLVVTLETIALIYHSIRTDKANRATAKAVEAIGTSVKLLERDKVYLRLVETAQTAKTYVHHLSFAQSTSKDGNDEERKRVEELLNALGSACKKLSPKDVKILGPDWPDKIGGLWERQRRGCEVRVSAEVSNYDVRIQVIDDRTIVLGVGPLSRESEHGFLIESYMLADVLNDRFMKLWDDEFTKPLEAHTIHTIMTQVKVMLPRGELEEIVRNYLHVPSDEIIGEILRLLVNKDYLTEFDGVFYKNELIRELHAQNLSEHELRTCLLEMGTGMSDRTVAKFLSLVRRVDGGEPVRYTSGEPPRKGQVSSESEPDEAESESNEPPPRDEPDKNG